MTDLVDQTLKHWRCGGHVWGVSDCMLSIGDYLAAAGHLDVTDIFRGTYDTKEGAEAHVAAYGGCEGLIDMTGVLRTETPERGDVAVLQGIGALCTGAGFALRLERGVVEVNMRLVTITATWKV